MNRNPPRVVVLGAGIAGLAAARELQQRGLTPLVLEACPTPGGLTRSFVVGSFSFDYTGHLLHLARYATPAAVPYAGLRDEDWKPVIRRSYGLVGRTLVPAPVQYHLGDLPADMRAACIASYETRPRHADPDRGSFRDFIVSGFGHYLADRFLVPQNEKTMATSLDRLSMSAVKRFFPPPDDETVRRGMVPGAPGPPEYNSRFWYPQRGGIGALAQGLARGLRQVSLLNGVVSLDLPNRALRTASGQIVPWEFLLSSVPLRDLCRMSGDPDLHACAEQLTHSTTVSINLGIRGPPGEQLRDVHWVYVPDRDIPFYRVGVYSNISKGVCPAGYSSLYVEVGVPGDAPDRIDLAQDLEPRVSAVLEDLGWLRRDCIVCRVIQVIRCAYVHHTVERDQAVEFALDRLARHGVYGIGRYGRWDYISMEDSIVSGISMAQQIAG